MRRILTAVAALSIIVAGCSYAVARERLRNADLDGWYAEDNARFFAGELQPVGVRWGDLQKEDALGITRGSAEASEIVLDRDALTTKADARAVLRHEICHVATWGEEPVHGHEFQSCMLRFSQPLVTQAVRPVPEP
jgi:hypothetical protein